jgi:hypothetical protein
VIAIRGTDTQYQWLEDFRAIAQPVAHGQWWMHQGFDDVWNSIAASLQEGMGHGIRGKGVGLHHWAQSGGGGRVEVERWPAVSVKRHDLAVDDSIVGHCR